MDDMNAFDRQLANVVLRRVGPSESVDDAAIFTTITATRSPKWRFQSMFSATKFVVAGAIVALFGGFLLSGVLMQPSEEQMPAVGASASAEAEPRPTDATAQPLTTEEVLASLDATEVERGIFRIDDDGVRKPRKVTDVQVTNDGQVLVMAGRHGATDRPDSDSRLYPLGSGEFPKPPAGTGTFQMRDDGTLVANGARISWFDGETWNLTPNAGRAISVHRTSDGTIWAQFVDVDEEAYPGVGRGLGRFDGTSWTFPRLRDPEDPAIRPGDTLHFAESADGTLFAGETSVLGHVASGVLTLDGDSWRGIEPPEEYVLADQIHATAIAFGPDGDLWSTLYGEDRDTADAGEAGPHLGRWDGMRWELFPPGRIYADVGITVDPDGSVWGVVEKWNKGDPAVARFDGQGWTEIAVPRTVRRVVASHDGSIWAVGDNGRLFVITPEAVAAAE
jgi:hypothetical protein